MVAICAIAAIGFAFDTYELLTLPLIVRPALLDLIGGPSDSAQFNAWVAALFYVPAVAGGVFGMVGGFLIDRLGRRRVLTWSLLVYAISAAGGAFATSAPSLLILRCGTFVGVCVEFVAAVAWLAELFDDPLTRERVLGYTQACGSLGGLVVSSVYYGIVTVAGSLPAVHGGHQPWRYMLISGLVPALPLLIVRPWLPESPVWIERRAAGTFLRPSVRELFQPAFRRTSIVTAIMVTCGYAASFGANLQVPRIVPGLPDVQTMSATAREQTVGTVQWLQELGGLAGRVALAWLAVRIARRRHLIRLFVAPGIFVMPLVFFAATRYGLRTLEFGTFLAGFFTVGQFSFWGNYLPRMYPTYLRGTGESFASNIGGRMLGTGGALVTTAIAPLMPAASSTLKLAYAAGVVGMTSFIVGFVSSRWLPEPSGTGLPA